MITIFETCDTNMYILGGVTLGIGLMYGLTKYFLNYNTSNLSNKEDIGVQTIISLTNLECDDNGSDTATIVSNISNEVEGGLLSPVSPATADILIHTKNSTINISDINSIEDFKPFFSLRVYLFCLKHDYVKGRSMEHFGLCLEKRELILKLYKNHMDLSYLNANSKDKSDLFKPYINQSSPSRSLLDLNTNPTPSVNGTHSIMSSRLDSPVISRIDQRGLVLNTLVCMESPGWRAGASTTLTLSPLSVSESTFGSFVES